MGISLSMNCPMCGGALSLEEGSKTTTCAYCGALLAIEGDEGINKLTYKNNLDKDKAISIAKSWMHGGLKARDLKNKAEITECYPIYAPFWKVHARAAGWVCGYREVHHEKSTERVPMEKMVMSDFDWNEIACDVGDIGVEHIGSLNGTAILHDEGSIPTFEATTSPNDAKMTGLKSIEDSAINSAGVPNKTFVRMHVFPDDISLVYYPIWVVRYKYNNRMYFCTVDGIVGKVLAGRAPGDTLLRNIAMSLGMLAGGYGSALGLLAMVLIGGGDGVSLSGGSIALGVGMIVVCLFIAYMSYKFFRYGSEVTTGSLKGGFNTSVGLGKGGSVEKEMLKVMQGGMSNNNLGRGNI
jgi:hypothetical protein